MLHPGQFLIKFLFHDMHSFYLDMYIPRLIKLALQYLNLITSMNPMHHFVVII